MLWWRGLSLPTLACKAPDRIGHVCFHPSAGPAQCRRPKGRGCRRALWGLGWGHGWGVASTPFGGACFLCRCGPSSRCWVSPIIFFFFFREGGVKVSSCRSTRPAGKATRDTMQSDFPTSAGLASLQGAGVLRTFGKGLDLPGATLPGTPLQQYSEPTARHPRPDAHVKLSEACHLPGSQQTCPEGRTTGKYAFKRGWGGVGRKTLGAESRPSRLRAAVRRGRPSVLLLPGLHVGRLRSRRSRGRARGPAESRAGQPRGRAAGGTGGPAPGWGREDQ